MLSQVIKDELKALVGKGRYLDSDEDLLLYSYDAFMVQGKPEAVLCLHSWGEGNILLPVNCGSIVGLPE